MARLPRLTFPGQPHLVVLPSATGRAMFLDDDDRRRFLAVLLETSRTSEVAIHAYVLLDDQVLMLVTPAVEGAISRFMQRLGRRYVAAFNQRHGRQGPLWERRYGAAVVDPATQVWRCIRLIELAPVRAGRVQRPQDWPWSSGPHHLGRQRNPLVREHEQHWRLGNTPFEREAKHAQGLAEPLVDAEAAALVAGALRGWPLGPARFVDSLAAEPDVPTRPQPKGRPRTATRTS